VTERCPICGDTFESSRGLGVHHSAAHDELLPNRECAACGEAFHSEHEQKYCSDDCREGAVSFEGEDNPNWDGGMESTTCDICGSSFRYYPSEKPGLYCPDCVASEAWRHDRDITGERNPRWSGGTVALDCDNCGVSFERRPVLIESEKTFCSRDCQYEWLSDEFTGDGHPNWRGGGMPNYRGDWREVRRRALERDDGSCVVCDTDRDELGRNPDVHHLVPVRAYAESPDHDRDDAHFLDNVVCLCPSCHRRAEFGNIGGERLRDLAGIE
jgi:predicted nucleic acid-binding Zn ribbon protein